MAPVGRCLSHRRFLLSDLVGITRKFNLVNPSNALDSTVARKTVYRSCPSCFPKVLYIDELKHCSDASWTCSVSLYFIYPGYSLSDWAHSLSRPASDAF